MNINAEAIITRWELTQQDTGHPAYIIAKFMTEHGVSAQNAIGFTREWMGMTHYYKGPWSWSDVQAVLDIYTEVNE